MATSKTLTPTNVTIQIPEFTDQPDQRVNSNCIDKEADAINALNTAIGTKVTYDLSDKTYQSGSLKDLPQGVWRIYSTATDKPLSDNGYCSCIVRDSDNKYQTFVATGNKVYVRLKSAGAWESWQQLAPKNETVATYSTSGNTEANVAKIWKIYDANLGYCLIVETRDGVQKKIKFDA